MAILEDMRVLVSDLEASMSSRVAAERDRRAAGARQAGERAATARERHAGAVQDARDRLAEIAVRRGDVGEMLTFFREREAATAAQDAQARAAGERDRLATAADDAAGRADQGRERAAAEQDRRAAAAGDARDRAAGERDRRATAAGQARERRAEHGEAQRIWREHTVTMAGANGRGVTGGKAVPLARHATAPSRTAVPAPRRAAGGATRAGRKAAPVSAADIQAYLTGHPGGVKLTELESHFGASRIVLARTMSELVTSKQARKNDRSKLYFAA